MDIENRLEQKLTGRLSIARSRIGILQDLLAVEQRAVELLERSLERRPPPLSEAGRKIPPGAMGYAIGNCFFPASSQISIYLGCLRELFKRYPEKRELMRGAVAGAGRNRTFIATDRSALFLGKQKDWAARNSAVLVSGWFADTNINLKTKQRNLAACARAAGLRSGVDFTVAWTPSQEAVRGADIP